jgi:hypothetical protein
MINRRRIGAAQTPSTDTRAANHPWRSRLHPTCAPAVLGLVFSLAFIVLNRSEVRGDEPAARGVDFARDVLPLLQSRCLDCHGEDASEGNLKLDSMLGALTGGDSGERAIVPGSSDQSYLITRITHADPVKRMPPEGDPLTADEIARLRSWIDDESAWEASREQLAQKKPDHWSFRPIVRPEPPPIDQLSGWNETAQGSRPIDAFVLSRLRSEGLAPSPRADRRTLIRRLYLVMHGLPPTPQEVEAFVNDPRDDAWPVLVEKVLASPHYGERIGTMWLDLVRFGETNGFETNRERPNAWRYRDWVIDAFNQDMRYDDFVMKQLAGDAVGEGLGTGFLVAGPYDLVKGQDALLRLVQRQDELADMINTTGTALLGLTLGCARCHNHKFDPVTQADYYSMQAIFAGVQHGDRALDLAPANAAELSSLDAEIAASRDRLGRFLKRSLASRGGEPGSLREPVNGKQNVERLEPIEVRFVRFTIEATNQGQPCIDELEIHSRGANVGAASAGAKVTSSGDFVHPLHKLEHINDGKYGNSRSWIAAAERGGWVRVELPKPMTIDAIHWGRDREEQFKDRVAIDYRIEGSLDGESWTLLASAADRQPFDPAKPAAPIYDFDAFPPEEAKLGREAQTRLAELTARRASIAAPPLAYIGNFVQPGPTHRLYRGEPNAPREEVPPGAIRSLTDLTLPNDAPEQQRRLALAKWIVDPANPLTPRVIVNRIWQFHFGSGIVDTPSDFGASGTPPSHPELLDWLAAEFVRSGWSIKQLHRLILNSGVWSQASLPRDDGMRADASSRLLWRFPPRRLDAESIRDGVLSVAGTLDPRIGGEGFSPFEVALENVRHYFPKKGFGPADWRRMVYMHRVRLEKDAVFGVFDCPDFNQVVAKRGRSTTPLQALNLFNSPFMLQQSELMAARLERDATTPEQRVRLAFELCFNRPPSPEEIAQSLEFIGQTDWPSFTRAMLNANEFVQIP